MNRKIDSYLFNMIEGILGPFQTNYYPKRYNNGDRITANELNRLENLIDLSKDNETQIELKDVLLSLLPNKNLLNLSSYSTPEEILNELNLLGYCTEEYNMKPYSNEMDIRDEQPTNSIRLLVKGNNLTNDITSLKCELDNTDSGSYTVNWGDGTIETFNSGVEASHTFSSGTSITGISDSYFNMITVYSDTDEIVGFSAIESANIIWVVLNNIDFNGNLISFGKDAESKANYEAIQFVKCTVSNVEDLTGIFKGCSKLKKLDLTGWDLSGTLIFDSAFEDCEELITLILPANTLLNCKSFNSSFKNCKKLVLRNSIVWNIQSGESFISTFEGCINLLDHTFPLEKSKATNITNIYNGCAKITKTPFKVIPNTVTAIDGAFNGTSITALDNVTIGSGVATYSNWIPRTVTAINNIIINSNSFKFKDNKNIVECHGLTFNAEDFSDMFNGNTALTVADGIKLGKNTTNLTSSFQSTSSLMKVDFFGSNFNNVTRFYQMFRSSNVTEINNFKISNAISTTNDILYWLYQVKNTITFNNFTIDSQVAVSRIFTNNAAALKKINTIIIGPNVTNLTNFCKGNTNLEADFYIPSHIKNVTSTFEGCTAMTHVTSNWNNSYNEVITSTKCYSGCTGITHIDDVAVSGTTGLDSIPTTWGGNAA